MGELRTCTLLERFKSTAGSKPLTPHEFIRIATLNGARALGLDSKIGSLEIGKQADFISIKIATHPVYNIAATLCFSGTHQYDFE
jgi:5-methylthioadenosine/S-adenosylhomocysteine deaminase